MASPEESRPAAEGKVDDSEMQSRREDESNSGGDVKLAQQTPSIAASNQSEAREKSSEVTTSPTTPVSSTTSIVNQETHVDFKSSSELLAGAIASPAAAQSSEGTADTPSLLNAVHKKPPSAGGHFPEKLVARGGLGQKGPGGPGSPGAGRSNIARFKSMTPSRLPIPKSPCLTIPPGLSPTTLLDSPVLLSAGQAQPSPTTGTFPLPPISEPLSAADPSIERKVDQDGSTFVFKPFPKMGRNPLSPLAKVGQSGLSHQQALMQVHAQAQAQASAPPECTVSETVSKLTGSLTSSVDAPKLVAPLQSREPSENLSQEVNDASEKTQLARQAPALPPVIGRPSEDGYNWRKYGQKQVKDREFPRSYYKCTHPDCSVKKKVEQSHDGQVREIVYKGEHNHPKPQATRRMSLAASRVTNGSGRDGSHMLLAIEKADSSFPCANDHKLSTDPSFSRAIVISSGGASRTPEPSSGSTSDDEANGDRRKGDDGDVGDPDSKRRKKEGTGDSISALPVRTVREPRVVVQTASNVDILDDGYRWRKYGQKVVKGNPHPRSYYKCTNLGCPVRKFVERSPTDAQAVITAYEGKHNHNLPAARSSNHYGGGSAVAALRLSHVHSGKVASANVVARPATSLQDQSLMGKLLQDRLEGDDSTDSMNLAGKGMRGAIDQQIRGLETLVPTSTSLMNSGATGEQTYQGAETLGQDMDLRPKEELSERAHMNQSPLQPTL